MFQTGVLRCRTDNIKLGAAPEPYQVPVPWFLITHPEGNVVIDGGNAVECAADPKGHWGSITDVFWPDMKPEEGAEAQLERLGIAKGTVRYVLQSHLHMDHTGAIGRFPNATHVVQRAEYENAFAPGRPAARSYVRKDLDRPGLKWAFLNGEGSNGHDLCGDRVICIVFTPGHTLGHQSFLVGLPSGTKYLLTGDAAYTKDH